MGELARVDMQMREFEEYHLKKECQKREPEVWNGKGYRIRVWKIR